MSWNGQQQNGYNGQQRQRRIPEPGKGRLRKTNKSKPTSPDFKGLINFNGQIIDLAIWFEQPRQGQDGQMIPESWSCKVQAYDPNAQQGQGQPGGYQQRQMNYGQPPPQNYAPPPGNYAPQPPPANGGGYAPHPGYRPPQPATGVPHGQQPPQQQQPPQWGGAPAQAQRPPQGAPAGQGAPGYGQSDIPF